MQLKSLLLPFLAFAFVSACTITNDLFIEKEDPPIDIQATAEANIKAFIQTRLDLNEAYKSYGFTSLKISKPIALEELELLQNHLRENPGDSATMNQIKSKQEFIRIKKIERAANLDHLFTITNDTNSIGILELSYTLNDTLGVINWMPKITLSVPYSYELIIDYFYKEHTLFKASTYSEARQLSHTFYRFFKNQLETLTTVESKSAFLKNALNICIEVKSLGEFDQNKITQALLIRHINEDRIDLTEYVPLEFSNLYETKNNTDSSLVGYYFFHKFSVNYLDHIDTNLVLVEFSPFYEIGKIFQLEGEMETYIKSN